MSYIQFSAPGPVNRQWQIAGTERTNVGFLCEEILGRRFSCETFAADTQEALDMAPEARFIIRLHAQVEMCPWVALKNVSWLREMIRETVQSSLQLNDRRVDMLRVGMSNYGRADLNYRNDRQGHIQTWWSLVDHFLALWSCEPLALHYSTTGTVWPAKSWGEWGPSGWADWLRSEHAHMEWKPETWKTWRAA